MAKLSFLDQLNSEQLEYARIVGQKAKEMGIPPELAISIAYHESGLNPNVKRGEAGEYGIMQVMPNTGKGMGFTNKDLADPNKNIEAGLKYLKQNLDAFDGDPKLATIGYNAGIDSPFFSGGEMKETTKNYLKAMNGYGAYSVGTTEQSQDPAKEEGDTVLVDAPKSASENEDTSGASRGERFLGGAIGTGVGALATGVKGAVNALDNRAVARATAIENAKIAAQRAAGVTPPAAPAAVPPGGPKPPLGSTIMRQTPTAGVSLMPPTGPADAGRMAAGQTGAQVYNYGKSAGLTDIEAGRALDMTKEAGGVHDLSSARREGTNKIQSMFPGEKFVENPRYGGLLTLDQGVGNGPRQSFSMRAPVAPSPDLPQGQPGGLSQLSPRQPVSTAPIAPKAASGLDAVTDMFKGMMRPFATAAKTIGKYALPPLAGMSTGLDVAEMGHEYDKPEAQRDYTKIGLKAASALGGGLSMFPPTAPVGIPLSLGATAAQAYRENPEYFNQKMEAVGKAFQPNPYADYAAP